MNLEAIQAELAKLGYKAVKMRKPKAKAKERKLTIWERRYLARAYKGPSLAQCIAARQRPEYIAQQARDAIRVAVYGPASAASHDHLGPKRLAITSQYMHIDRRAEAPAREVYLPDKVELESESFRDAWLESLYAELDEVMP